MKGLMLHSVGCPSPRRLCLSVPGTAHPMIMPVCMGSLTGMTGRCTRHFPGTTGAGTAAPAVKAAGTTPTSGWRCASLPASGILPDSNFTCSDLAEARTVAKRTYGGRRWNCLPCCVKQYNLNPIADGVIISHREGAQSGNRFQPWGSRASVEGAWSGIYHGRVPEGCEGCHGRIRDSGAGERRMVPGSGSPGQTRSPRKGRSKCLPMLRSARMRIRGIRYTMNPGRLSMAARD